MAGRQRQRPRVRAFIKIYGTNSQAALVETDRGEYVIKAANNKDGPPVLVAEWVGCGGATWLGIPTPDFAVVEIPTTVEVPLDDSGKNLAQSGPCFGSKLIKAFGWEGDAETLAKLANPESIPSVVVLDTWLRNVDRFCQTAAGKVRFNNPGNLLLATKGAGKGQFRMLAIDFGYSLGGPAQAARRLTDIGSVEDPTIYGCFPAFSAYMRRSEISPILNKLRQLGAAEVQDLLADIPREWGLDSTTAGAIADFLRRRAVFVADMLDARIWEDDRLW